jgi:hypothetical protein
MKKYDLHNGGYDATEEIDDIDMQIALFESELFMSKSIPFLEDMATEALVMLCDYAVEFNPETGCVPIKVLLNYYDDMEQDEEEENEN